MLRSSGENNIIVKYSIGIQFSEGRESSECKCYWVVEELEFTVEWRRTCTCINTLKVNTWNQGAHKSNRLIIRGITEEELGKNNI